MILPLGKVVGTPAALKALETAGVSYVSLLSRHASGDWGDLDPFDKKANEDALVYGNRILSAYVIGTVKVWIITEHDRSYTTLLLPSEY